MRSKGYMVAHEYDSISILFPSAVSRTDFSKIESFSSEERIQRNHSCAAICISHKQFLAKNFAAVELDP